MSILRFFSIGIKALSLSLFLITMVAASAYSADRLYFTSIVEQADSGEHRVILEWGPLEGGIPGNISRFKIYKSENGGDFKPIEGVLNYGLVSNPEELDSVIKKWGTDKRFEKLVATLQDMDEKVDYDNYQSFLFKLLDPKATDDRTIKRMLLIRRFPEVAIATGLGVIDPDVKPSNSYQYMLTAVRSDSSESLPLGKSGAVDPAALTFLPAPTGLKQIFVNACSEIRKNLDDNRIHFAWDIPFKPNELGLKVLTYGYDVFWSESDLGTVDLNDPSVHSKLNRVNDVPIVIAGPPEPDSPDSFLSRDDGSTHLTGPEWKRGQAYYYYLAAIDLAGNYSGPASPLKAEVLDMHPPVAPWNIHPQEVMNGKTQQLAIIWDQINSINYIRHYGSNKNICSADDKSACYTRTGEQCSDKDNVRCVDIDIHHYEIYRFESPAAASKWGIDADGDKWPDYVDSDPCDALVPGGNPPEYVTSVNQTDTAFQRTIGGTSDHVQMKYVDTAVTGDNRVHWYRVISVDRSGNRSSVSAPIRGVLYDKKQPVPNAGIKTKRCTYTAEYNPSCGSYSDNFLKLIDSDKSASAFELLLRCFKDGDEQNVRYTSILKGATTGSETYLNQEMFGKKFDCDTMPSCGRNEITRLVVRFFDNNRKFLAESDPFLLETFCPKETDDCVILNKTCVYKPEPFPGFVIDEWPVKVCLDLEPGDMARIYQLSGDSMSPVATIPTNTTGATLPYCYDLDDLDTLVPADLCLGVRIFSQNHVGSGMYYLPCGNTNAGNEPPEAPEIEEILPVEEAPDKFFKLKWASDSAGLIAFQIVMTHDNEVRYFTDWAMKKDDYGQFVYMIPVSDPDDMDKKWCFKIQAIDQAFQRSDWSNDKCEVWEVGKWENLPWPTVAKPITGSSFTAFVIKSGEDNTPYDNLPAIVMSDDLTYLFNDYDSACPVPEVISCNGEVDCIDDTPFIVNEMKNACLCNYLQRSIRLNSFIVYRQEEGRDFVQAGPLVEGFYCKSERPYDGSYKMFRSVMHDPYIFFRNFEPGSVSGGANPDDVTGHRLVYFDRYPCTSGTRVRYKIMSVPTTSGEPETVHTTNWVDIP